jgi:hypothetical protein
MAQSFMVNGKFVCPELPPSCFGLALHYKLTAEDVTNVVKIYGEDNTQDVKEGDVIECAMLVVRDKPYKKRTKKTKKINTKKYDTCTLANSGKPGEPTRLEALARHYQNQTNEVSPFSCDLAELVSKSAIGKAFEEYYHTEGQRNKPEETLEEVFEQ